MHRAHRRPPIPGTRAMDPSASAFAACLLLSLLLAPAAAMAAVPPLPRADLTEDPVQIVPASPCSADEVRLVFTVCTCNATILSARRLDATHAQLDAAYDPTHVCVQCAPDTIGVAFGKLPAGPHRLDADIVAHIVAGPDSGATHVEHYTVLFGVSEACPDPGSGVPYLGAVSIGDPRPCAGDSIPVFFQGLFPTPCLSLAEVRVLPSPLASPLPGPNFLQLIYRDFRSCARCIPGPSPWSSAVRIAPLPRGDYRLPVSAYLDDGCDSADSLIFLGASSFPFTVAESCSDSTASGCFLASFAHAASGICDASVGPDRPAEAILNIAGPSLLAGLQGKFVFDRPGLHVTGIEAIPTGTVLEWHPTPDGATFVFVRLIRDSDPPAAALVTPTLRVRVALAPGARIEGVVRLVPTDLLASDKLGRKIPVCGDTIGGTPRLADPAARFCSDQGCDFNGDGGADVRDLVLMVGCIQRLPEPCFVDTQLDCDGNGNLDLDDVLCCARGILGGGRPDDAGAQPAPEVAFEFGAPVATAQGIDVPAVLTNQARVGAARLVFTYPGAVFDRATVELTDHPSNWLALDQDGNGRVTLGAIRLASDYLRGDASAVAPALRVTIHLGTRAGQAASGSVALEAGDFADQAGATLVTSAAPVAMPLAGGPRIALSAARPNPFSVETRFRVALTEDSDLEVSVFDLVGRRVATLFRGRATAGTRDFSWRRVRDDGSAVGSGVYFFRARAGGLVAGQKVLVLSRE
ncbi:MAG: T9SS type A sorting domain-containing protein [Candidatus Eisenbacteria bacterium]